MREATGKTRHERLLHRIARLLSKRMYELIRDGRPLRDADGYPLLDKDGKQLYSPPTAADYRVVVTWLRFNRVRIDEADDEASYLRRIAERANELALESGGSRGSDTK